jgi:hypothetical protein
MFLQIKYAQTDLNLRLSALFVVVLGLEALRDAGNLADDRSATCTFNDTDEEQFWDV